MEARSPQLRVQEHFVSLQGEGELVGIPSTFVRVSGCNLRCHWCDSPATSWNPQGDNISLDALMEICAAGPRHVVITGGEPLLYPAVAELSHRLHDAGHHITVETAGTVWLDDLYCDLASVSPKLAHSAPHARDAAWGARHDDRRLRPAVITELMNFRWQLKYVVRSAKPETLDEDVAEIEDSLRELGVSGDARRHVLLMPECIDPNQLPAHYANLVPVCQGTGFRLGQRLHIALFGHTPGT